MEEQLFNVPGNVKGSIDYRKFESKLKYEKGKICVVPVTIIIFKFSNSQMYYTSEKPAIIILTKPPTKSFMIEWF